MAWFWRKSSRNTNKANEGFKIIFLVVYIMQTHLKDLGVLKNLLYLKFFSGTQLSFKSLGLNLYWWNGFIETNWTRQPEMSDAISKKMF